MVGHISYSSVVFGLGNSEARKQQNALWTCHDSPTQKPELIWNCATSLCLVICALLPTPTTKVMLGKVCVVIYDEGSTWWGTSKYKGKIRSGLGFKMQEKKKLVTRMSSHCLTCFGSLDRREWVRHTPQEQAAGTPRSRKWSWKTQGWTCIAKGVTRPTVAVHASSAPHRGPDSETRSRRRPCWTGATGWSAKEPTSSKLSTGTSKGTITKTQQSWESSSSRFLASDHWPSCCCKSSSSSSATTEEDHEEQKLMSSGLRDIAAVFLRSLEPNQHLRGCNQRQLPVV